MVNLHTKILLVVDYGSFFETALKLADSFKKVLYYVPWENGFPGMDKWAIGREWKDKQLQDTFDGKNFQRIETMWDHLEEVDCIFHTDVYGTSEMEFLRKMGYPVCSSGNLSRLELMRFETQKEFKAHGMDVINIKKIIGVESLREELKKVTNKFIKISKFRKHVESFHHINYELSLPLLRKLESELGPLSTVLEFTVWDPIDSVREEGYDGFCVSGEYPKTSFSGIEKKDVCYAGGIVPYDKMSEGIRKTNAQIAPILKEGNYRGFFSTEVRTTKDGKNYLIDPTMRLPQPPSALYGEIFDNLAEIIWSTANGELVDIKPKAKFGLYAVISSDWYDEHHQNIYFPDAIRDHVKLNYPIKIDGKYTCLNIYQHPECGALVTVGDSFDQCKKELEKLAPLIEGYGVKVDLTEIDSAIEDYNEMMKL
jgi:hypothetical protein